MDNFPAQAPNASSNNSMVFSEKDEKVKKTKNLFKKFFLIILALTVVASLMLVVWYFLNKYIVIDNSQNKNQIKTTLQIKNDFIKTGVFNKKGIFVYFSGEVTSIDNDTITISNKIGTYSVRVEEPFGYAEKSLLSPNGELSNIVVQQSSNILFSKVKKGSLVFISAFDNGQVKKMLNLTLYVI